MYMMYPSVNIKQFCIIILANRNNHTDKIENVLTIKAIVKESFLFNVYIDVNKPYYYYITSFSVWR